MPMIGVDEHLASCLALVTPLAAERVPLEQAEGRVLAETVRARVALPGFDNSAMDGYAVRAADVADASADRPAVLEVIDDLPAGKAASREVVPGTAIRIMTGAPVPPGTETIVQVEHTDGGTKQVRISVPTKAGLHRRRAGEDVAAGEEIAHPGTWLGPRQIGLLAAVGHPDVLVSRRPRVLVLATGTELVSPGADLAPGQIYESNGRQLAAAVREAGGVVSFGGTVADDPDALTAVLAEHLPQADLVLTSGGVSAGAYDTVKEVLAATGTISFVKVAMQPGMPQGCGQLELNGRAVPLIALPGNPVSTYVSFQVFVRPVIAAMTGLVWHRALVSATATQGWRAPANKRQFARVALTWGPDGARVRPVSTQRSHLLAELAGSNALAVVDEQVTQVSAGDRVACWLLPGFDNV